ncbi:MAG: hypothetical protein AAGI01_05470 [Myxococcota bacterium]
MSGAGHEQWVRSEREQMLEALRVVLEGIEGVRFVSRQTITGEQIAEGQLPAILIDELRTRYVWRERHGKREAELRCAVAMDLQAPTKRVRRRVEVNASTVRELFVHQVLDVLANNPTLSVQLPGETEPLCHARDVFGGQLADVRYFEGDGASARALVTIDVVLGERFDGRTATSWQELVLELGQEETGESARETTIDLS